MVIDTGFMQVGSGIAKRIERIGWKLIENEFLYQFSSDSSNYFFSLFYLLRCLSQIIMHKILTTCSKDIVYSVKTHKTCITDMGFLWIHISQPLPLPACTIPANLCRLKNPANPYFCHEYLGLPLSLSSFSLHLELASQQPEQMKVTEVFFCE